MGAALEGKLPRLALSLAALIIMVLGLMVGTSHEKALADDVETGLSASAELQAAAETYPLWIGETQVTSANLTGQGWSFAPAADGNPATLTLNGYSYTGPGHMETLQDYDGEWDYYRHAPIFWNDGSELVVELAGESSIVVTADSAGGGASGGGSGEDCYCGIFCDGSLTVKGSGSLAANAGGIEDGDAGIYVKGDVNIEGGTVTAKGYRGISVGGDIVINGGEVSAECTVPDSYTTSIMVPCGIACDYGTLTVNGGTVAAKGHQYGIYAVRHPSSGETGLVPGIVINGGSIVAESRESESSAIGINGCIMTVKGGSVQATGSGNKAYGVSAISSLGKSGSGSLVIEEGVASFIAQGPAGAINADTSVTNAVLGLGYSDVAGIEGKTPIAVNAEGEDLSGHKRAVFPAIAASATTPPAGKNLSYTGKPQELVAAGAASGGTMLYSLDGETYAAELPTATDPGEYTIYYKVVGDASHVDSEVQTVTATIAEKGNSTSSASTASTARAGGSNLAKTGDVTMYAVFATIALVALAAAALAFAARRRRRN